MAIVVIGMSHRTSPVTVRERFAFSERNIPEVLGRLRSEGVLSEGVIVSTCNRVEIYAASEGPATVVLDRLEDALMEHGGVALDRSGALYRHAEPRSLSHLFEVVSGLDSMVLGETEILGQVKKAYDLALSHRLTGGSLNRLFQRAFQVAKQIRTQTGIQRGSVSVGSVAVELAEKIFTTLNGRQVMVLGAGDTSEKTARSLVSRGATSVLVSNRSYDRAEALALELGGRAVHFDDWADVFHSVDIVISSTSAPHYVLDRPRLEGVMRKRSNRPLFAVDIAVPRDIDPEIQMLENVYLYNIDDLQAIADSYLAQRREELARCREIIDGRVRAFLESFGAAGRAGRGASIARPRFRAEA